MTFRTLLRIRNQPIPRLRIVRTFLLPQLDVFADEGAMISSVGASKPT